MIVSCTSDSKISIKQARHNLCLFLGRIITARASLQLKHAVGAMIVVLCSGWRKKRGGAKKEFRFPAVDPVPPPISVSLLVLVVLTVYSRVQDILFLDIQIEIE